jgi:Protein of unknown function (DUF5818)
VPQDIEEMYGKGVSMSKTLMLALALLLSAAWLQAQEQYPQAGSSQTGATASGQTTVQGCLQGSDENYTLTDKSGTTYQLQGDTSKLSAHVGHEVQITGTTSGASAASPSAGAGTTNPTTGTPTAGAQQSTLTVQNMKHISKTCTSASPK